MTQQSAIWEEDITSKAYEALKQVGISTGRREIKKLSSKGIAVVFRRGNKIIERQNGNEIVIQDNLKPFCKIKVDANGVAGCINKD